jgi:hypothetical protein
MTCYWFKCVMLKSQVIFQVAREEDIWFRGHLKEETLKHIQLRLSKQLSCNWIFESSSNGLAGLSDNFMLMCYVF